MAGTRPPPQAQLRLHIGPRRRCSHRCEGRWCEASGAVFGGPYRREQEDVRHDGTRLLQPAAFLDAPWWSFYPAQELQRCSRQVAGWIPDVCIFSTDLGRACPTSTLSQHGRMDARRLRCSSVPSLMMMDDSRDAPRTCFDSRTGSKDKPPLARTVESVSLNSRSGELQLEPQLHFLALEHATSEKLLHILKTPTLAP